MYDDRDVSSEFMAGSVDDESLPITQCMCGEKFNGWADFVLSIYREYATECPKCHRKFYFRNSIRIFQVGEE